MRGKKNTLLRHCQLWGSQTSGEGCRAGSGHGAIGSPGWDPPQVLAAACCSLSFIPSSIILCSFIPQRQAPWLRLPGSHLLSGALGGCVGCWTVQWGWCRALHRAGRSRHPL